MKKILAIILSLFVRNELTRAINVADAPARIMSAINVAFDAKSEWSTMKFGVYPNARGLQVFDREAATAMVKTFNSTVSQLADAFRGLPGYVGHPDDPEWARANPGVRAAAIARIREMRVGDKGLEFRTAFNDEGKRLVSGEAPAYEAYSPNWGMVPITYQGRKAFRPVELYSIGFTNQPNIPGTFIGLNEALPPENQPSTSNMKAQIIALLAALGRPITNAASITDDQLVSAANEAMPVATKLVTDAGQLVTATNEKSTLTTQLATANAALQTATNESAGLKTKLAAERTARADLVITCAINEGKLTEAKRAEWLSKFTAAEADFAKIEGEVKLLTKAVNTKTKTDGLGDRRQPTDQGKVRAINEAVTAKKAAVPGISHLEAYNAVRAEKPELFEKEASQAE